jgi:hypothetical protein
MTCCASTASSHAAGPCQDSTGGHLWSWRRPRFRLGWKQKPVLRLCRSMAGQHSYDLGRPVVVGPDRIPEPLPLGRRRSGTAPSGPHQQSRSGVAGVPVAMESPAVAVPVCPRHLPLDTGGPVDLDRWLREYEWSVGY